MKPLDFEKPIAELEHELEKLKKRSEEKGLSIIPIKLFTNARGFAKLEIALAKGKKYYVVWAGHKPGVYDNWNECLKQTKNFPAAKYKSFKTRDDAHNAFLDPYSKHIGLPSKINKGVKGQQDLSKFGNISFNFTFTSLKKGNFSRPTMKIKSSLSFFLLT